MNDTIHMTKYAKASGCAAKIGPGTLAKILGRLPKFENDRVLVGLETGDDAAVYKISDDVAMIQTLDFFPPIVDDPYMFGQIAAANALSDIYAMGGQPAVALNIVAFPKTLDISILGEILKGGADKVREAGAVLVGGHSVQDEEPKYGLCVSGFVHPDKIWKNFGAKPGDVLILTKQIGVGLVNTAIRGGIATPDNVEEVAGIMSRLNKYAKEVAQNFTVHACTDVTGFGLLGHCCEMAEASNVSFNIHVDDIAFVKDAADYARMGLVPGGTYANQDHTGHLIDRGTRAEFEFDLLYDPQTSGGLLFAIPKEEANGFYEALLAADLRTKVSVIGEVTDRDGKLVHLL